MTQDIFPPLPELPALGDWQSRTQWPTGLSKVFGSRRRETVPELHAIDGALRQYADCAEKYRQCQARYAREDLESAPALDPVQLAQINYDGAAKAFATIDATLAGWHWPSREHRDGSNAVSELQQSIDGGRQTISDGRTRLDELAVERNVPNVHHLAWVGGVPGDDVLRSARIWAASSPGSQVNIWTDENNLLAKDFKTHTAGLADGTVAGPESFDPVVAARRAPRQAAPPQGPVQGLDALLQQQHDPALQPVVSSLAERRQQLDDFKQRAAQHPQIVVRDVSELFVSNPPFARDTLTAEERRDVHAAYQREVGERCNFAAASDIVRVVALHDKPGLYTDVDVTPPIRGLDSLMQTWDRALPAADNRILTSPQGHPRRGLELLKSEAYCKLVAAAEEHIDGPCSGKPADDKHYQALVDYATRSGTRDQLMPAFDAWRQQTQTLDSAFEPREPIAVAPKLFKMLQSSDRRADSNSVLAASEQGAPALADWARHMKTMTADLAQHNPQSYFNERHPDYKEDTLMATGPSSLTQLGEMRDKLQENYGIAAYGYGRFMIPNASFPHPSSAENDHSWLQEREAQQQGVTSQSQQPTRGRRMSISSPQRHANSPRAPETTVRASSAPAAKRIAPKIH